MTTFATVRGVRAAEVAVPSPDPTVHPSHGTARLGFDNGLERLELHAVDGTDYLLEASFVEPLPAVWADGSNVHVAYPLGSRLRRRAGHDTVRVDASTAWALDVHGGATELDADLTAVDVRSVTFHAGSAHTRIALSRPAGARTIRLTSVKDLCIERPAGVAVTLEVARGATGVTVDDQRYRAVGGAMHTHTRGGHTDEHRYHVIVSGAADTLTITEAGT